MPTIFVYLRTFTHRNIKTHELTVTSNLTHKHLYRKKYQHISNYTDINIDKHAIIQTEILTDRNMGANATIHT